MSDVSEHSAAIALAAQPAPFEQSLAWHEKLANIAVLRKLLIVGLLALGWQLGALRYNNPLLLPTLTDTLAAFGDGILSGQLPGHAWASLKILLSGFALGIVLSALVTGLAVSSRLGNDLLELLTAMFNPLPAIALLPLALLWFGLGNGSLIFVLVHSVLWSVALNMHAGFHAVSPTLRMVGRNYGLRGGAFVVKILIPAAFPSILAGLKIGWAFAWRTLIAAELVFGVSAGSGGLGWFIFENKNELEIPSVFAGLLTVILIGLAVENLVFRPLEIRTVKRWGMHG